MNKVFLSLGTNIASRKANLAKAINMLSQIKNILIASKSSLYKTNPLYNCNQNHFLNQVIEIYTSLAPKKLLKEIKSIEALMGRDIKNGHNMPRIIDIDILTFENISLSSKDLTLPHPRILERKFVLMPWQEIAPDYILDGQTLSIKELYNNSLRNIFKNQKVEIINN